MIASSSARNFKVVFWPVTAKPWKLEQPFPPLSSRRDFFERQRPLPQNMLDLNLIALADAQASGCA
jgi:hypothetical protein